MKEKCCYLNSFDTISLSFREIAGFHFWSGFQRKEDGSYYTDLWKDIFRSQAHMNGEDVINTLSEGGGGWKHGMQSTYIKISQGWFKPAKKPYLLEDQYYVSKYSNYFIGYVRNRTYNIHTKGCANVTFSNLSDPEYFYAPQALFWDQPPNHHKLKVWGLSQNSCYHIFWYSRQHYLADKTINAGVVGQWVLQYPLLSVTNGSSASLLDRPVLWFVAYKTDCNNSLKRENTDKTNQSNIGEYQNIIYPNPFNDYFIIVSSQEDILLIETVDGRIVEKQQINRGVSRISTKKITSGIYLGVLKHQGQTFKLIKI